MANDTINELTKTVSQASRRVTAGTSEALRTAGEVTRHSVAQGADVNHKLFEVWSAGAETTLKATFDLQNAMLNAGLSFLDNTSAGGRRALQEWIGVVHETQAHTLEAWQASMK